MTSIAVAVYTCFLPLFSHCFTTMSTATHIVDYAHQIRFPDALRLYFPLLKLMSSCAQLISGSATAHTHFASLGIIPPHPVLPSLPTVHMISSAPVTYSLLPLLAYAPHQAVVSIPSYNHIFVHLFIVIIHMFLYYCNNHFLFAILSRACKEGTD